MNVLFFIAKKFYDWFNAKWTDGKMHATAVVENTELGKYSKVGKHSYCANSKIGNYSYVSGYNLIVNTEIGNFCSIGSFVSICTGIHPTSKFVSTSPVFYSQTSYGKTFADKTYFSEAGKVVIGHDVWIGSNVVIVDNVTIGHGAVIAAGAIVVKDVPPYAVVGGVPAKILRMRFDDQTIEKLMQSEWWNRDEAWFKENYRLLHDVNSFIDNTH